MTKTARKVISAIPGKSRIPSTGLTGHIGVKRVPGEMTETIRVVISIIPFAPGNPSTGRVAVIALQTPPAK